MSTDHWRDPTGFEGLYQVTPNDGGQVRALERQVPQGSRWGNTVATSHHGRVLKPFVTPNGRRRVVLHDADQRRHARYIDDLVAQTCGRQ